MRRYNGRTCTPGRITDQQVEKLVQTAQRTQRPADIRLARHMQSTLRFAKLHERAQALTVGKRYTQMGREAAERRQRYRPI